MDKLAVVMDLGKIHDLDATLREFGRGALHAFARGAAKGASRKGMKNVRASLKQSRRTGMLSMSLGVLRKMYQGCFVVMLGPRRGFNAADQYTGKKIVPSKYAHLLHNGRRALRAIDYGLKAFPITVKKLDRSLRPYGIKKPPLALLTSATRKNIERRAKQNKAPHKNPLKMRHGGYLIFASRVRASTRNQFLFDNIVNFSEDIWDACKRELTDYVYEQRKKRREAA